MEIFRLIVALSSIAAYGKLWTLKTSITIQIKNCNLLPRTKKILIYIVQISWRMHIHFLSNHQKDYSPCKTPWDCRNDMSGYLGGLSLEVQDGKHFITKSALQLKKNGTLYLETPLLLMTKCGVEGTLSFDHCFNNSPVLTTIKSFLDGTFIHLPSVVCTERPSVPSWNKYTCASNKF